MKKNDIAVLKMEHEGLRITLRVASVVTPHSVTDLPTSPSLSLLSSPDPVSVQVSSTGSYPISTSKELSIKTIISPMVGTFYAAPSPEAVPFVQVGTFVTPDTVVCIVEAMKVMNEIKAEVSGAIVEILAESGTSVQFGQPLFRIK